MRRIVFALLILFARSGWASDAYFETGNSLKGYADDKSSYFSQGVYGGYIIGVADVLAIQGIGGLRACFSTNMEKGQLLEVVKKYLADHPQNLHLVGSNLIAVALAEAFPCGKRN